MEEGIEVSERLLVVAGLLWTGVGEDGDNPAILVQRRSPRADHGAEMLELPGGKVEMGESPQKALQRELEEEMGPAASGMRVHKVAEVLHHCYAGGPEVLLLVFHVDARMFQEKDTALFALEPGVKLLHYALGDLPVEEFLEADRPMLQELRAGQFLPDFGPAKVGLS